MRIILRIICWFIDHRWEWTKTVGYTCAGHYGTHGPCCRCEKKEGQL